MRTRKKPDLRIDIPSYPHDYVEMPPETRKKIEEVIRSSVSPSIDHPITPSTSSIGDPDGVREGTRIPEVRLMDSGVVEVKYNEKESTDVTPSAESPVVFRKVIRVQEGNEREDCEKGTKKEALNVSLFLW